MITAYSLFVIIFNLVVYAVLGILYKFNFKIFKADGSELPTVSILIAVRDEEQHIENLLNDLRNQNYPKHKLQILIGNDGSKDRTRELLFKHSDNQIHVIDIEDQVGHLKGKMNVLAQLSELATGDYLLFTDADVRLNENWVKGMILSRRPEAAMNCGFTGIETESIFQSLQHVDMVFGQGMLKVLNDLGMNNAVIGNNLLVSRDAYSKVGGYKSLPFSVVEDVALMQSFLKKGYGVHLNYTPDTYLTTIGESSWSKLMIQRKRWMAAFATVPYWLIIVLIIKVSFLPALLYLLQFSPWFGLFFVLKVGLALVFYNKIAKTVKINIPVIHVVLYEFFEPITYFSTLIYYILPAKVKWKGREY
ncbi:glycosyltransferase [Reichenbachiella sp. MALMAid0571]|uniref:glycosyltransferase n=1 Tax=Reichenbachiella sp. MALMAid0571 TaxID=3143939 RepID=UPI0032DE7F9C